MIARAFLLALILGPFAGCETAPTDDATQPRGPLRVAAASDLQAALPALAARFAAEHGIAIVPTFGASGTLAAQIDQGAPFDLFLSADRAYVESLAKSGRVRPETVRPYALGHLVLVVHEATVPDSAVRSLADLRSAEIRKISIANPAFAPYGKAARGALERAGLWESLAPKLVQAESVRQALRYVSAGDAEAGLVARSVAGVPGVRIVEVDPPLGPPLVQVLGIVTESRRPRDAAQFADFLASPSGRSILASFGLDPGPGT